MFVMLKEKPGPDYNAAFTASSGLIKEMWGSVRYPAALSPPWLGLELVREPGVWPAAPKHPCALTHSGTQTPFPPFPYLCVLSVLPRSHAHFCPHPGLLFLFLVSSSFSLGRFLSLLSLSLPFLPPFSCCLPPFPGHLPPQPSPGPPNTSGHTQVGTHSLSFIPHFHCSFSMFRCVHIHKCRPLCYNCLHYQYSNTLCRPVAQEQQAPLTAQGCSRLHHPDLCKDTLWCLHNKIAKQHISGNVTPSLSDAGLYMRPVNDNY